MLFNVVILSAFIATLCWCANGAEISGIWSEKDVNKVLQRVRLQAGPSAANEDIYHSLQLLKDLSEPSDICSCKDIATSSLSGKSALDWFWAKSNSDLCGCGLEVPLAVLNSLDDSFSVSYPC